MQKFLFSYSSVTFNLRQGHIDLPKNAEFSSIYHHTQVQTKPITSKGQGQWKWYKMVEVYGAYKHGRHERIWLKNLCVASNVKVFAVLDRQPDIGQLDKTLQYTDPYATHMDKKQQANKTITANQEGSELTCQQTFGCLLSRMYWVSGEGSSSYLSKGMFSITIGSCGKHEKRTTGWAVRGC